MPADGEVRIHVPRPVGLFWLFQNRWDPLDVLIDGALVGRIAAGQTQVFPITTGQHVVQVRWARVHHIRSNIAIVAAEEHVTLTLPLWVLAVTGLPRLQQASPEAKHER